MAGLIDITRLSYFKTKLESLFTKSTDVADEYSETSTYAVGDCCVYEGRLYICTTAVTTAEAWDSAKWSQTTVKDIMSSKADKADTVLTTTLSRGRYLTAGEGSIAFGYVATASGAYSQSVGYRNNAVGAYSHAEGSFTNANGESSHAEGLINTASGKGSHAEGTVSTASGDYSHAEGAMTTANHKCQHVFGGYNVPDSSEAESTEKGTYVEIVGNGTSSADKSNARALDWSGNEYLAGDVYINCGTDSTNGTAVGTALSGKVAISQGTANAGKILVVGSDGNVACTEDAAGDLQNEIDQLCDDMADAYDASATYAVGDYVIYNNVLYRCTTEISTAEAWTAAHWTATAIGDVLASHTSNLTTLNNQIVYSSTQPASPVTGQIWLKPRT